jgi:hypothetical protein
MHGLASAKESVTSVRGLAEMGFREGGATAEYRTDLLNDERHQPSGPTLATLIVCIIQG